MPEANAPSRRNARLALWLACAWVATGALFKFFSGSPNDLPETVRNFALLRPEWTFKLAIGIELSIVILALARPRAGWIALALLFVVFDLLLWQMMQSGEQNCGCFGSKVPLTPGQMMAIDTVLLVALLVSRVWSAFPRRALRPLPLLPLFAIVIAAPWFKFRESVVRRTIDEDTGEIVTDVEKRDWHRFVPAEWSGEVLADTDLAGFLTGGPDMAYTIPAPAYVVLYRFSCEHCKLHFEHLMEQPMTDRPVVLILIPEDAGGADVVTPVKPVGAFEFELDPLPKGYGITTPVAFDLDETWTVQNVVERPVGAENE